MPISNAVNRMGQWCKAKIKNMAVSMKREFSLMKMRRALSIVINMRDMSVRHRSELSKALGTLNKMMEGCGCGKPSKDDDNDGPDVKNSYGEKLVTLTTSGTTDTAAAVNNSMKTTSSTSMEMPKLAAITFSEHQQQNQGGVNVHVDDHEYTHAYDVPGVKKTETPSVSEIQVEYKNVQGEVKLTVEEEGGAVDDKKKCSKKCKKCKRHAEMAKCFESAVADINKSLWSINKYITECAEQIARLESTKKRGWKNRAREGRAADNGGL